MNQEPNNEYPSLARRDSPEITVEPFQKEVYAQNSTSRHKASMSHLTKVMATGELQHRGPVFQNQTSFQSQNEFYSRGQQTGRQGPSRKPVQSRPSPGRQSPPSPQASIAQQSMGQQSMDRQSIGQESMDQQSIRQRSIDQQSIGQQSIGQQSMGQQSPSQPSTGQQSISPPSSSKQPSLDSGNSRNIPKENYSATESIVHVTSMRSQSIRRPQRYFSKPYTFRIPVPRGGCKAATEGIVKSPPFYLQLDHTLAVIWSLFCKDEMETPLGIAQMQWALLFLKGIYNRRGQHPKDVEVCIQAIQDQLIDQYASLMDEPSIQAYVVQRTSYGSSGSGLHGSSPYAASRISSNLHISSHSIIQQHRPGPKPNDGCCGGDSHGYNVARSRNGCPTGGMSGSSMHHMSAPQSQVSISRSIHIGLSPSEATFSRSIPFSINYVEMSQHNPKGVEQLFLRPCARRSYVEEERLSTPKKISSGSRLEKISG